MRWPLIVLAFAALIAAIWIGFPMTGIAVMATIWLRALVIGLIVGAILLNWLIRFIRRRRAARALEVNLIPVAVGDGVVLAERMTEALAKLKKSGGKTYLYDLPWYIIIGPPGAGKTTAMRNSGIEFPGSKGQADGIEGFGGTKNCDWWFAEDAVLIDTAGRYTTQDSDAVADKESWTAFLDQLKKGRPHQPINGVILAFSAEDMMTATPDALTAHAETVRLRLAEVHETLKIDFPVYVMFTKADMISGFREYFSSFSQSRRKAVWGATFQTRDRTEQTFQNVVPEFDLLVSRLSDEIIDRMAEEPDGISRIAIFGLPGQMALLRDNIADFLRRVFEPTRYKTNAILRGFYFTSGTQEGTPIDQVLGAMAQNQDDAAAFQPAFMSGKGKSFFLHDLLKKVIFQERDWVSHDARAVRRLAIMRTFAMSAITIAALGTMGAFGYSFWKNANLLRDSEQDSIAYFGRAQDELKREVIDSTELSGVMDHLDRLRMMTAGYGDETTATTWEGLGLGQRDRINTAADHAYSDGLERMLRPRLMLHMENVLPQLIIDNDTAGIYRALKVYILLGGQQGGQPDDAAVEGYFGDLWRVQFGGAGQLDERDSLSAHLTAMLELDDTRKPELEIDPEIVRKAREAIVNLPIAQQAYASIKDRALTAQVADFNLVEQLSGQVEQVFVTTDGSDLKSVMVPRLFTFEGYWGFFLEELTDARQRLEDDQWVLGDAATRVNYEQQLANLEVELHRAYQADFIAAWKGMFARITIAPMSNDPPNYEALSALASPVGSPVLDLVEKVDNETRLTRLYDQIDGLSATDIAAAGVGANLGDAALNRMYSRSNIFQRVIMDSLRDGTKVQERVGGVEEDTQRRQVERLSEEFEDWQVLLQGNPGARPIDAILASLGSLRENRRIAATAPSPTDEATLQPLLSALTVNNSSLPDTLARMLNGVESEFRSVAEDASLAEMNRALNQDVTQFCQQFIEPLFPFGNGRHVASNVFGEFFGYNGRMEQFYNTYLQYHVVRTASGLEPLTSSSIGARLNPSALRSFEQAEAIRAAFFDSGSQEPQVSMFVTHESSSPSVELSFLTINGSQIQTRPNDAPAMAAWPGTGSGVQIELFPGEPGRASSKDFNSGRWAIVDFLRDGRARADGNVVTVTHEIGGRTITYKIEFDSTTVPFLMPELSDFSCPTSLG